MAGALKHRRLFIVQYVISALIAAAVSAWGIVLNRRWQVRQAVRSENLAHYRLLKTFGFIFTEGSDGLFEGGQPTDKLREGLLQLGTAIHEIDLTASPAVLRRLVSLLREVESFNTKLEQVARAGTKVSHSEFEEMKAGMRNAYVRLFRAMRADAGSSNLFMRTNDLEYLLFVRFGRQ